MPVAVARVAVAAHVGVQRIDEAVGNAREADCVALFVAQLHILEAQEGRGGQANDVYGQGIQSGGEQVIEERPCQGLLVDVPGAQDLLRGAADAVKEQIEVCEGQVASIASFQDIGGVLQV